MQQTAREINIKGICEACERYGLAAAPCEICRESCENLLQVKSDSELADFWYCTKVNRFVAAIVNGEICEVISFDEFTAIVITPEIFDVASIL